MSRVYIYTYTYATLSLVTSIKKCIHTPTTKTTKTRAYSFSQTAAIFVTCFSIQARDFAWFLVAVLLLFSSKVSKERLTVLQALKCLPSLDPQNGQIGDWMFFQELHSIGTISTSRLNQRRPNRNCKSTTCCQVIKTRPARSPGNRQQQSVAASSGCRIDSNKNTTEPVSCSRSKQNSQREPLAFPPAISKTTEKANFLLLLPKKRSASFR